LNFFGDSYILHYGNDIVSRTGNKEIRHFLTTINKRKNPLTATAARHTFSLVSLAKLFLSYSRQHRSPKANEEPLWSEEQVLGARCIQPTFSKHKTLTQPARSNNLWHHCILHYYPRCQVLNGDKVLTHIWDLDNRATKVP